MLMQCQRPCSKFRRDYAENTQEITAEVQGNHPKFKRKIAEKENFVISKVNESQPLFGKKRLRAAMFQKMTTMALSKKKYESANKNFYQKAEFSQ